METQKLEDRIKEENIIKDCPSLSELDNPETQEFLKTIQNVRKQYAQPSFYQTLTNSPLVRGVIKTYEKTLKFFGKNA
jgi:hypothetical protein